MTDPSQTMPRDPKVSVVMPAYNAAAFVGEAIQSVIDQTFGDWELIIVDDGSTDGTRDEVSRFTDTRIICLQQANTGPSGARRAGLRLSRGRYLLFFDADDRLRPNALARLTTRLDEIPDVCVAYGDEIFMTEDGRMLGSAQAPRFSARPSGNVLREILRNNFIFHGAVLVRADRLARVGFDYDGDINEDWVVWCGLAALGAFSYIGPGPILEYRLRRASLSRVRGVDVTATLQAIDVVFADPKIQGRLPQSELKLLRAKREAVAYAFSAKQALTLGQWRKAIAFAITAVAKDLSVPREFILPQLIAQTIERRWSRD